MRVEVEFCSTSVSKSFVCGWAVKHIDNGEKMIRLNYLRPHSGRAHDWYVNVQ